MDRTSTRLSGTVIAAMAATVLGAASAAASATPSAAPATSFLDRAIERSPATAILVAAGPSSPSAPVLIVLPPSVVVDPTQVIGPLTPTPESPAIARKEAMAALADAKKDCRRQPDREQKRCLGAAQDDYRRQMAYAHSGTR